MAKKTVWDLSLEIAGKDTGAGKALKDLQGNIKDVQKAGKQLSKDFKNFASNAGKLAVGAVAGVTAAGAATLKLAGDFAAAGDQAAKTADSLGMGIEGYQQLRYAMGTAGVEAGEFDGAIQKMSNTINMATAGNAAAAKQLESIGLSAKEFANMKPEESFAKISDYMATLSSDAERTQVAITLFGKTAGPKMMAAMRMGSEGLREMGNEAQSLGLIITEEQARASENYNDALARMKGGFTGLKNQFIGSAIGPITQAFDHLKDAMVEQGPLIKELGEKFGKFLAEAVQKLPEIIQKVKEFGTWIKETVTSVANFVGGWQNLAKIIAVLAIAPTFISGIKVVISLFGVLKAVVGLASGIMGLFGTSAGAAGAAAAAGGAAGATGFGALAAAVWAATWPVLAVIAAIAAVIAIIVLVVKNFDKIKEVAGKVWDAVCGFVGKAVDFIKNISGDIGGFFKGVWDDIKNAAGNAWDGIKNAAGKAWDGMKSLGSQALESMKNGWGRFRDFTGGAWEGIKGAAGSEWEGMKGLFKKGSAFVENVIGCLPEPFQSVFVALKIIIDGFIGFWKNVFTSAFNAIKNILALLPNLFSDPIGTIKAILSEIGNFFKNVFQGAVDAVNGIINGLAEKFGGVFASIKEKIESFVNFFKGKMDAVKNFFAGGFSGRGNSVPGHADGGIFTHRHIAEIAERGAEAVVPLNRSPHGFDIWKQAGEIGGYADRISKQAVVASPESTPPVMQAAAQRISGGENVVTINFNQNNTFSGGTPDKETVNQIAVAGQRAAGDFEAMVKQAFDNIKLHQRRVGFA